MQRSELEEVVLRIVRQEKNLPEDVDRTATLRDVGIDSLDALSILFALEEHFKIAIPDEKARAIVTLSDMVDVIADLTSAANA